MRCFKIHFIILLFKLKEIYISKKYKNIKKNLLKQRKVNNI